jgi:hypothetical protein
MWIVPAIVVFLLVGFTAGPLKGCIPEKKTPAEAQTEVLVLPGSTPVIQDTSVSCTLPTNQTLCDGCMNGVVFADRFVTYRCNHGELAEVKSITTTAETVSR